MYISACKETKELVESDFIEATKIEENIIHKSQFYQVYKNFLKSTDENFYESLKWIEQKGGSTEDGLDKFLKAEEKLVRSLHPKKNEDYILCQELECPVCLTEMVPPVKIWTCKSGHLLCQSCKRNPNIRQKCPTCRGEIIGRATSLEKIAAALFKKTTGKEPTVDPKELEADMFEDELGRDIENARSILEMVFYPQESIQEFRSEEGISDFDLDAEMRRFFTNLSLINNRS